MSRPSNNFDFLRLMAATFVIVGHQFVLAGRPELVPSLFGRGLHAIGVEVFFAISGYLVATSWRADPHLPRFFFKRVLRILPGLAGVCIFSIFFLGALFTRLPLSDYFSDKRTYFYLSNIALHINYFLPGLFEKNPVSQAVNGSLWSLPAEFLMYMLTAGLGLLAAFRSMPTVLWAIALASAVTGKVYLSAHPEIEPVVVWATSLNTTLDAGVYFLGGACLSTLGERFRPRLDVAILALLLLALLPPFITQWMDALLFSYVVLACGLANTPLLRDAGRHGDISYGLYLYAFPVQQIVIERVGTTYGIFWPFVPVILLTTLFAAISWHLLEKPALRFKPGRSHAQGRQPVIAS